MSALKAPGQQRTQLIAALAIVTLLAVIYAYRLLSRTSNISTWNAFLMPLGALIFVVALIRSALVTLKQGGVIWRGTFYPLAELRKNAAPLF